MTRYLPGILAMGAVVLASNILVQHPLGNWLTYGALTYPIAFLVTDVMNRVYGAQAARRVVFAGFLIGVICSLIAAGMNATTLRIAIASGTAFLTAQLLDVAVFDRLRRGAWWQAPLASTLVGSFVDTALFFSLAFSSAFSFINPADDVAWANEVLPLIGMGPEAPLWMSLAAADWMVKLTLSILALVPFRIAVNNLLSKTQEI